MRPGNEDHLCRVRQLRRKRPVHQGVRMHVRARYWHPLLADRITEPGGDDQADGREGPAPETPRPRAMLGACRGLDIQLLELDALPELLHRALRLDQIGATGLAANAWVLLRDQLEPLGELAECGLGALTKLVTFPVLRRRLARQIVGGRGVSGGPGTLRVS